MSHNLDDNYSNRPFLYYLPLHLGNGVKSDNSIESNPSCYYRLIRWLDDHNLVEFQDYVFSTDYSTHFDNWPSSCTNIYWAIKFYCAEDELLFKICFETMIETMLENEFK